MTSTLITMTIPAHVPRALVYDFDLVKMRKVAAKNIKRCKYNRGIKFKDVSNNLKIVIVVAKNNTATIDEVIMFLILP